MTTDAPLSGEEIERLAQTMDKHLALAVTPHLATEYVAIARALRSLAALTAQRDELAAHPDAPSSKADESQRAAAGDAASLNWWWDSDHTPIPPARHGKRWHILRIAEVVWRRWGLGIEVSLEYWWPVEWSIYLHIGPVLLGFGLEERHEWRYGPDAVESSASPSSEGHTNT